MKLNCPNCGKPQSISKMEKTNKEDLNEYRNKLKDSIKRNIQEELREDFKKKLEEIDKKYSVYNDLTSMNLELSQLIKDIRLLKEQKGFKEQHSEQFNYKMESLIHSYNSF